MYTLYIELVVQVLHAGITRSSIGLMKLKVLGNTFSMGLLLWICRYGHLAIVYTC